MQITTYYVEFSDGQMWTIVTILIEAQILQLKINLFQEKMFLQLKMSLFLPKKFYVLF